MVVIPDGVGSQSALSTGPIAVPRFVEAFDSHSIGLKEFLNDIDVSIFDISAEIGAYKSGERAHAIDEKLHVEDTVFFPQLTYTVGRKYAIKLYIRGAHYIRFVG